MGLRLRNVIAKRLRKPSVRNGELWPIGTHLATVGVLAVTVFAAAGWLIWYAAGSPSLAGSAGPARLTDRLDLLKITLSVVAGVGGLVALVVAYRRQRITERQDQRENTKLFNERFTATSGQLGHDAAAVRLAGVFAMAGLAGFDGLSWTHFSGLNWPRSGRETAVIPV